MTEWRCSYIINFAVEVIHSCVGVAQLDRAFGYGPKGREFESSRPRYGGKPKENADPWKQGFAFFCIHKYKRVASKHKKIESALKIS